MVLGADLAGQRYRLTFRVALDRDRPDRPRLSRGGCLLVAARNG
jgi:hypothetical protein